MWRTTCLRRQGVPSRGISIHVPRVEDDLSSSGFSQVTRISIHVPRVEDDIFQSLTNAVTTHFNPRPPCGGRHQNRREYIVAVYFNPRPPCGGRHWAGDGYKEDEDISIHVPRVEDDAGMTMARIGMTTFQSTSPVWRTTAHGGFGIGGGNAFQSTSPVWRTTKVVNPRKGVIAFQSTSPVWRTTYIYCRVRSRNGISIHVPRVEDDLLQKQGKINAKYFNPRPPCGGRPYGSLHPGQIIHFNPRPPCGGRPKIRANKKVDEDEHFNPRPPCGGRPPLTTLATSSTRYFNPRPPCGGRHMLTRSPFR